MRKEAIPWDVHHDGREESIRHTRHHQPAHAEGTNTNRSTAKVQLIPLKTNKKQTPWSLVRERTIPTERPPLVDEI
jgi:hypothetical protein